MVLTQNENDYLKFINGIRGPSAAIYLFQLTQKMGNGEKNSTPGRINWLASKPNKGDYIVYVLLHSLRKHVKCITFDSMYAIND